MIKDRSNTPKNTESIVDEHMLEIVGAGEPTNYSVTVTGTVRLDPHMPAETNGNISGKNAEGTIHTETHRYHIRGEIADIHVDGDANVSVDGMPILLQ